jgi:uroporphyrinogen decarboxylase
VLPAHREIAAKLGHARAPLVLFVGGGPHLVGAMAESGADVLSLDWRVDLAAAAQQVGARASLQGNLDPCALSGPPDEIRRRVRDLIAAGRAARGHVLNLGHGILPDTPVEGVRAFVAAAREAGGEA